MEDQVRKLKKELKKIIGKTEVGELSRKVKM